MSEVVLDVSHLGKSYVNYASNLQRFGNWFGMGIAPQSEFRAVEDISFRVNRGESIALIGQNGAGKSTLLKMLTGTVRPTRGTVGMNGRVSAILELGLGFNPDFTGRQNVYQAGGMMGFSHQALTGMMQHIQDFAEIGQFFEEPVRVYSSGMQARLAFALATAQRPDVLIIDEVLAVGDSYFSHKCSERIRAFRKDGTSIILVSHSMVDVRALCDRVILLDKGRVLRDGQPDEVVDYYNALIAAKENAKLSIEQRRNKDGWLHSRSGTGEAGIESLTLVDAETQEPVGLASVGQNLEIITIVHARQDIPRLVLGQGFSDRRGQMVWGTNTWHTKQVVHNVRADARLEYRLRFPCNFAPGSYSISSSLVSSDTHLENNYEWQDNMLVFDVVNTDKHVFIGTTYIPASIQLKELIL